MATIIKSEERNFAENPNKIDGFRIFTDNSRTGKSVNPQNLNFDLRSLHPGQCSAPYHFHRYAEELFMILSGASTLRTPAGVEVVKAGDVIFFEMGESGAHQLFNHTDAPCEFLDIRTYIGFDVCEYPDSNKLLIAPSFEVFDKDSTTNYFEGEEQIPDQWRQGWK
jgi:uncharacterized cupin superfamily protein